MIQVNVNGFLSDPFPQSRGLRQGDPLSPLLFNIAFDPLLRAIDTSPDIQGFQLQAEDPSNPEEPSHLESEPVEMHSPLEPNHTNNAPNHVTSIPSVKVIAYADDTLVTLSKQSDFHQLQRILDKYMNASNAKLNYDKTQVLSLSGAPHPAWQAFLQDQGISHWHDKTSPLPLIYLGYAIVSSPSQRAAHAHQSIAKLRQLCQLYGCRSLSFRGKVTIVNSLIYSKLWHMLRLFSFSQHEMHQIQQIAASFINHNAKIIRFAFDTLTTPRKQGGLQLINPQQQAHALQ